MRSPAKAMLCSKLAIATALVVGATPAAAQGINGTVTTSTGISGPIHAGNTTTIDVTNQQAVINWSATGPSAGGLTTFQNSSQTLTFQSEGSFAVLNRVAPTVATDAIYMNGTVNSLVNGQTGGTVYFYSPRGVVIGASGRINVGSLGLTTSAITEDGQGNWMTGFGTASPSVTFGGAAAGSYVRIDSLAEINANGSGNYIALVAPHVALNGTIRTDGAAALVGASAATITFNTNNLFDIVVTTGSSDSAGVVVNGGTIARNSEAIGGDHRAYLVSVPANNAMTMLIQGGADLGFDIAGSAGVEGNAVVLSAGRNIFNGEDVGPPNNATSLTIDNAAFTSDTIAHTTNNLQVSSWNGATSFTGSLTATAVDLLTVQATANNLTIGGNLSADVDRIGFNAIGGEIRIGAYGGTTMDVDGSVTLSANGTGFAAVNDDLDAGDGRGGTVLVQANDGSTLDIGLGLTVNADGTGGRHEFSNGAAGDGRGGTIQLLANGGSQITVGGATLLSAKGTGGSPDECSVCSITGGYAKGGIVQVNGGVGAPSSLSLNGGLTALAYGSGGSGDAGAGIGEGGEATLSSGDGTVINIGDHLYLRAYGSGGAHLGNGTGGSGIGGTAGIGSFGASGGSITAAGVSFDVEVNADGSGGSSVLAGGQGGLGDGGIAYVDAPGAAVTINGGMLVTAAASGGSSNAGTGGAALGGAASVRATGANLTVNGGLEQRAEATGGDGNVGGNAEGGTVDLLADNGAILTVNGFAGQYAYAHGGSGGFGAGGLGAIGEGGTITVRAVDAATLDIYQIESDASARGGDGTVGGLGDGGDVNITTETGGSILVEFQLDAEADASGGFGYDGNGGFGDAGNVTLQANTGLIAVDDQVLLSANGTGGGTGGAATTGGRGEGGIITTGATGGGTLRVLSSFRADALGRGGGAFETGALGGVGQGGTINLSASGTNSTVDARFLLALDATGSGGFAGGDCNDCGGGGSEGIGGDARVQTTGGTGNRILVGGDLELTADGRGTGGYGGPGGDGSGGDSIIDIFDNGLVDVTGDLAISAQGSGGGQSNGGVAGSGTGGNAAVNITGTALARIAVGGTTMLSTDGSGGDTFDVAGGTAGAGQGGWSRIFSNGGIGDFNGNATISANGSGGDSLLGSGGNGTGGLTRVNSDGATYTFDGDLSLSAVSTGGNGATGGDALAFIGENPQGTATTDAKVFARSGSITVLGATSLDVSATGGSGANGGAGGDAASGYATVHARNGAVGPATVTLADLTINAASVGGAGGTGTNGATGGTGGAGGSATGGFIAVTGSAGNGQLSVANVSIDGSAVGGRGGDGGTGASGAGGNGGVGGAATGTDLFIGTENGEAVALAINIGSANFTSISSVLNATGGDGGWGGSGTSSGVGGTGGAALGGDGYLNSRGSLVTVGAVNFTGHAVGGDGGRDANEALSGTGGNATAGGLGVMAINRIGNVAQRGSLNAGAVTMTSNATGGSGLITGLGYAGGRNIFAGVNSDMTLASFSMVNNSSGGGDPAMVLDPVYLSNGNVTVTGAFNFTSPGVMSLRVNNGTLSAGSFTMNAGNFIADSFNPAVVTLGTVSAGSITLLSGEDVIVDANLVSSGPLTIDVVGDIDVGSVSAGGDVTLDAGVNLTAGNVSGGSVTLLAGGIADVGNLTSTIGGINVFGTGLVDLGDINSADFFFADTDVDLTIGALTLSGDAYIDIGGDLTTGNIDANNVEFYAGGDIDVADVTVAEEFGLEADGAITAGNVTAGDDIEFEAGGAVVAGDLSAGIVNPSTSEFAEYNVGLVSATSVSAGDIEAAGFVGIATFGTVDVGSIESGSDVLFLADGNIISGAITTGVENRLLIAGSDMVEVGGGIDDFDSSLVFNAVDFGQGIPTAGSVTINGTIDAFRFDILAGNNVTLSDITLSGWGMVDAGGLLTLNGDIDNEVTLISNDIDVAAGASIAGAQLVSRNAQGTFVGDGLSGSGGYRLSNAEYNRFGQVDVGADISLGAASLMTIGDLSVANAGFAEWDFAVFDGDSETGAGTIRVVGDMLFTGMSGAGEEGGGAVDFTANRFQLDAATGSISLEDDSGGIAGAIEIDAQHVHVAEGAILDRIADNPDYAELAKDLATPTETARPDGVIRAGEIYIYLNNGAQQQLGVGAAAVAPYSIYVQNTGTAATRAGFFATYAEVEEPFGTPPGSIDMIVNGQLQTEGGTLTGVDVRDALVEVNDPERFTARSTINGCALTGSCIIRQEPPPINPTPDIQTQISLIGAPTGDDLLFGNEETIEDNEEDGGEDSASSPIQPPTPLFNTKPLEVPGETDEPVSGGGNPALVGNGPVDDSDDDEEDE